LLRGDNAKDGTEEQFALVTRTVDPLRISLEILSGDHDAKSGWRIAAVGLALTTLLIALFHPGEFLTRQRLPTIAAIPAPHHTPLLIKSVVVMGAMMIFFFAGQLVAKVAIVGGALLLFTRRVKAEKVYRKIDWPLLVMFVGLFIVVAGLETAALTPDLVAAVGRLHLGSVPILSVVTAGLSNLVSNVPAVLVLKPFVADLPDPNRAWLAFAMASTLAATSRWSDRSQPDRRTARTGAWGRHRILGIFQSGRATDSADHHVALIRPPDVPIPSPHHQNTATRNSTLLLARSIMSR
jgi:Citrate transporter